MMSSHTMNGSDREEWAFAVTFQLNAPFRDYNDELTSSIGESTQQLLPRKPISANHNYD